MSITDERGEGARRGWGWDGPAGIAEVMQIALPMALSTGCVSLALFADRMLLHRHDPSEMAAAMPGGNLFWTLVCFPAGVASMTSAFVSQYCGTRQQDQVGRFMFQAVWLGIIASVAVLLVHPWAAPLFAWSGQPESLAAHETVYLQALLWGGGGIILDGVLSGFYSGTERATVVLWVNLVATVINILLDIVLIFGLLGIPELGIGGAGFATAIAMWSKVLIYAGMIYWSRDWKDYGFAGATGWDGSLAGHFLLYSIPAGMQYLFESGGFLIIVLQIGQLGEQSLAATTMAINFNMLAFIPLIGVSIAASVAVGRHLTERGRAMAMRATRSALVVGCVYAAVCAVLYVLFPDWILQLYRLDGSVAQSDETTAIARILLRFVAGYCVLDAIQLVLAGALRGAGDTWFVLGASLTCTAGSIAAGWWFETWGAEYLLYWWWCVITLLVCTLCITFTCRILGRAWSDKRLVEK